ncbi:MAG TPA: thiamine pyrophosphate-binding protein [Acidimicrobiales bacterium]|nr:thiamine pyrophosphate-binding protein [Acidimicrobiales bacterium]
MTAKTGRFAMIEQFMADGITHMFGNPGTVEQGFLDSLSEYSDVQYILALQEAVVVGIADGYARATRKPTIVQLHSGVGLGNGIGMMYQAKRGHAPLVVIAGESGIRYDAMEAQMWADLVDMAAPVTKWATRVVDPGSLLRVLRRAMKEAATPPMGPVFVSLPMDVLDAPNTEEIVPTSFLETRSVAPQMEIDRAAKHLVGATRPLIIAGDGVAFSGAQPELTRLAELWGAEVWGADWSEVNMDHGHPQFKGMLGHMFGDHSQAITSPADAVLIVGTYVFPEVFPELSGVFGPGVPVVHVDLDAHEIAKNFPVTMGFVADPKPTLAALADAVAGMMDDGQKAAARQRGEAMGAAKAADLDAQKARDRTFHDSLPLHASLFAEELARQLPADAIIFDEALTTSPDLTRYLTPTTPGQYYLTRGGSLGVGIPGAVGLKIANPDKPVWGFTGDGGSMYTYQALWTAARYGVAAKFVVCNNSSYELLKLNIEEYWKERDIPEHGFPVGFDLAEPPIHFADLARALGVEAVRVETVDQIAPAISQALAHEGPFLIDLVIASQVEGTRSIAGADKA